MLRGTSRRRRKLQVHSVESYYCFACRRNSRFAWRLFITQKHARAQCSVLNAGRRMCSKFTSFRQHPIGSVQNSLMYSAALSECSHLHCSHTIALLHTVYQNWIALLCMATAQNSLAGNASSACQKGLPLGLLLIFLRWYIYCGVRLSHVVFAVLSTSWRAAQWWQHHYVHLL